MAGDLFKSRNPAQYFKRLTKFSIISSSDSTDRTSVQALLKLLHIKGVTKVIISPGSRNAPFILAFTRSNDFECFSIPDERSAGFIALGMAQQLKAPVALVCTSGSALLNYYPAVAEAYYQKIPLVVISADRPGYLVDQGDGQTIRQEGVFRNHILAEAGLREYHANAKEQWFDERKINEVLNAATGIEKGPVHLNFPFEEPLYTTGKQEPPTPAVINVAQTKTLLSDDALYNYGKVWNESDKIMMVVGQQDMYAEFRHLLKQFASQVMVLCEVTSNLHSSEFFTNIDRFLVPLSKSDQKKLRPDLLVTFGGAIVSKKIKAYLREYAPKKHWHVCDSGRAPDTFRALTDIIPVKPQRFLQQIASNLDAKENSWLGYFKEINKVRRQRHSQLMKEIPFTDLKVFQELCKSLIPGQIAHLANSTPVRYAQLFNWQKGLVFHCNRGTSGIDGSVSTAVGCALATRQTVWLITGDMSFFYDSNAFWHRHIPANLKILVINNGGGGIFRFIDGPASTGELENFFETHQDNSVRKIAESHHLHYEKATDLTSLREKLAEICNIKSTASIIEVETPKEENAQVLKAYFSALK